jgi:hypothetical protein
VYSLISVVDATASYMDVNMYGMRRRTYPLAISAPTDINQLADGIPFAYINVEYVIERG